MEHSPTSAAPLNLFPRLAKRKVRLRPNGHSHGADQGEWIVANPLAQMQAGQEKIARSMA